MSIIYIMFCALVVSGCAQTPRAPVDSSERRDFLARQLREQSEVIQSLREENMVLKEIAGVAEPAAPKAAIKRDTNPETRRTSKPVAMPEPAVTDEKFLYTQVIQNFRRDDAAALGRAVEALRKYHPQSVHADNALFLAGQLALKQKRVGDSLKIFDEVIERYPSGNKRMAALFAKGVAYKELNLKDQARKLFQDVIGAYPGSPEAHRASLELKYLNK